MLGLADVAGSDKHREAQNLPCLFGQDHSIVPEPSSRVVATRLPLVSLDSLVAHTRLLFRRELLALPLELGGLDLREHSSGLFASHDCNLGIRPHVEHAGVVGPAAHTVVSRTIGGADDAGDFGDGGGRDCVDHFGPVLSDTLVLVLLADHESSDVLQEDERHLALRANLNKIGALCRSLAEENAVVGDDAHLLVVDTPETSYQR